MYKKIIVAVLFFGVLMFSGVAYAHTNHTKSVLPSPGIKPGSIFFFFDQLGESMQEFFAFSPEAKAKLQIKFSGERIAEINALVETQGPEAKGINKAKALLFGNVAHAAEILKEEKANGKDVAVLAKEIDDEFDAQEQLLIQSFQDARKKLKENRLVLKRSLAEQGGDETQIAALEKQISDLKVEDEKLKDAKDEMKESLHKEKKKVEEELDDEDKQKDEQEAIEEDEQEEVEDAEIEDEQEQEEVEDVEGIEDVEDVETENKDESKDKGDENDDENNNEGENGNGNENKDGE